MTRDPYTVLGVAKTASAKDIKAAYRKLAKKHHPDQNRDDPKAKEGFAELSQANDILGDEDKRKAFDRGGIGKASEMVKGGDNQHGGVLRPRAAAGKPLRPGRFRPEPPRSRKTAPS